MTHAIRIALARAGILPRAVAIRERQAEIVEQERERARVRRLTQTHVDVPSLRWDVRVTAGGAA